MRIAQVCPPWLAVPPKGYGGIEWVVALLADGLAEAGHDVTLFATGDSETTARLEYVYEQAPGSHAINDIMLDTTHTLFALRDARERFDVLHVHTPFSALAAAVETGVPTVHTLHGSFTPEMTRLYSFVADRAWFVAISQAQRSFGPGLRYAGVVHNGIDMSRYALQEEKEDFILFLGRGAPEKGWARAIEAANRPRWRSGRRGSGPRSRPTSRCWGSSRRRRRTTSSAGPRRCSSRSTGPSPSDW
jgi:glycosyltransferase involved in cell wall biosynthesis